MAGEGIGDGKFVVDKEEGTHFEAKAGGRDLLGADSNQEEDYL